MARSSKKGPYIDAKLVKKTAASHDVSPIKTYARGSDLSGRGHHYSVHNGHKFIEVYVTEHITFR